MELFIALCWANWHSRNRFVFEGKKEDPQVSMAKSEVMVEAYRTIKPPPLPSSSSKNDSANLMWKPPPIGKLKVNVDAATRVEDQILCLEPVIRDHGGIL